ncbi:hypothetical protein JCM3765_005991 [Sporobolomyces pararoseus]
MREIRTVHTNYPSPVEKSLVDFSVSFIPSGVAHASPTSNTKPGYSFRFPSTVGGTHGSTNLVVYIVPALFAVGLVFLFGWWLYVRRGRRARAKAFRESLEVEARLSSCPPAIAFLRPVPSSCSLAAVFEKSFETPPVFPPSRPSDDLSPPPPMYSPGWSKTEPPGL